MYLISFQNLPQALKSDEIKPYYDYLSTKKASLFFKRLFDITFSILFIIVFSWLYLIIALAVAVDSGFPIIYKQNRITTYGKEFKVYKFRTMVKNADKIGSLVTVGQDSRITKVGAFLRKYRLDELPQIFNVLGGSMSFVGVRPEVEKYVSEYTPEMYATLLLPAGITSPASIAYKNEAELLESSSDPDSTYIKDILPQKMVYNFEYIKNFSFFQDIKIIFKTVLEVLR